MREIVKLKRPVEVVELGGDLLVIERMGLLEVLPSGRGPAHTLLDIRDEVSTEGEQGLLGLAVAPDQSHLYLSYTDRKGDNRVDEYALRDGKLDPASRRHLLRVNQPTPLHNGGHIAFGPDGFLWLGVGEGGESHGAAVIHANGLDTLLGTLVRIDPRPSADRPYSVPPDNPFVDRKGARPEIWAYGLRNPWRWSFDPQGDALWVGDVGGYTIEEVHRLRLSGDAGAHLGWPYFEGRERAHPGNAGPAPRPQTKPLLTYRHANGRCSVIGGRVYRGERVPSLRGAYVFTDFCDGHLRAIEERDGRVVAERDLGLALKRPVSISADARGELIVVSINGKIARIEPR